MVQVCLEAGFSIFRIWGVSEAHALLGGFAVCGVILFSLLFCIYIEVVRSTLLKIPLSLPFGKSGPFNESAWFEVAT